MIASLIVLVFGILLGILLTATSPDGVFPLRIPYTSTGWLINVMRSLPQSVMIILMIPVARLLFGHSYGRDPCIIAIAASCIPMFARIVESSLKEITKGKIDAAKSVGCTNRQIVFRVIVPETLPSIIRGFTVAVISIISMTALAGLFGAGGIGDVAVRFGYQRFQHDRLFACVYILVILVQVIQGIGNGISNHMLRNEYPRMIKCCDRATILNMMIGVLGYTLCSGIICEELNGGDFVAVPYAEDEENPNSVMEIGYITRKNSLLSSVGEKYVFELKKYLGTGESVSE